MRSEMKVIVLIMLFSVGAATGSAVERPYKITLPNGRIIEAELPEIKWKGLMGRESLCESCGMIFIYEKEWYHGFWMKDTLIPLAMIWINGGGEIVHIEKHAEPCVGKANPRMDCKVYRPSKPARFVLEVNPEAARGLEVGMKIKSEPFLK